jgi:ribosome-binding factor A
MHSRSTVRSGVVKRPAHRIERVNEIIKEILSELLLLQIKDPRVGMVTITSVRASADLSSAKVFYTVMGGVDRRADTEKGLRSAKGFMRKVVADELKLRAAPELRFEYDDSLDRAMGIEKALKNEAIRIQDEEPVAPENRSPDENNDESA